MRYLTLGILITLLATGISTVRAAVPARAALIALEYRWLQAIETRDRVFLNSLLADNFTDVSVHGEIRNKQQVLNAPAAPAGAHQHLSDIKVRRYGTAAVVTGLNSITGPHAAWHVQVRFTDVFVKYRNRWQAVSAQETQVSKPSPINRN